MQEGPLTMYLVLVPHDPLPRYNALNQMIIRWHLWSSDALAAMLDDLVISAFPFMKVCFEFNRLTKPEKGMQLEQRQLRETLFVQMTRFFSSPCAELLAGFSCFLLLWYTRRKVLKLA